jgi:hypothetical protein
MSCHEWFSVEMEEDRATVLSPSAVGSTPAALKRDIADAISEGVAKKQKVVTTGYICYLFNIVSHPSFAQNCHTKSRSGS